MALCPHAHFLICTFQSPALGYSYLDWFELLRNRQQDRIRHARDLLGERTGEGGEDPQNATHPVQGETARRVIVAGNI